MARNVRRLDQVSATFGTLEMAPDRKFQVCDVREILASGGQPLAVIESAIHELTEGEGLKVIAPFAPTPLIQMLASDGFASRAERGKDGEFVVYFWKKETDDNFCNS